MTTTTTTSSAEFFHIHIHIFTQSKHDRETRKNSREQGLSEDTHFLVVNFCTYHRRFPFYPVSSYLVLSVCIFSSYILLCVLQHGPVMWGPLRFMCKTTNTRKVRIDGLHTFYISFLWFLLSLSIPYDRKTVTPYVLLSIPTLSFSSFITHLRPMHTEKFYRYLQQSKSFHYLFVNII